MHKAGKQEKTGKLGAKNLRYNLEVGDEPQMAVGSLGRSLCWSWPSDTAQDHVGSVSSLSSSIHFASGQTLQTPVHHIIPLPRKLYFVHSMKMCWTPSIRHTKHGAWCFEGTKMKRCVSPLLELSLKKA